MPRVKVFDAVSDVVVNVKTEVTCPVCDYLGSVEFSALPTNHKTIHEGVFRRRYSVLFGGVCEHMTDIWLSETPEDML